MQHKHLFHFSHAPNPYRQGSQSAIEASSGNYDLVVIHIYYTTQCCSTTKTRELV